MVLKKIQSVATWRVVAPVVAIWIGLSASFFMLGPYSQILDAGKGTSLPEERFGYSSEKVEEWFDQIGPEGRRAYNTFQLLDIGNAILAAVAMTLALMFTLPRLFGSSRVVLLIASLPLAFGVLEICENILLQQAVSAFPNSTAGLLAVSSPVTRAKLVLGFILLPLTAISFLAVFVVWLRSRFRRNQHG
jgi:hypothetical protein